MDFTSEDANLKTCLFTKTPLGWLWHRRLAHVGMSSLKKLMKNELVRDLKDVKFEKNKLCSAYRVFNHATGLVEETFDVEFDESNSSQGTHENLDDVGDESLREAMKNIPV